MTRVQLTKPHHQLGSLSLTTPSDMASPNPGGLSHDPRGLYPIARVALHSHPGKPALPGNAVASTSCFCLLDLKQSSCVSSRHAHTMRVLASRYVAHIHNPHKRTHTHALTRRASARVGPPARASGQACRPSRRPASGVAQCLSPGSVSVSASAVPAMAEAARG